MSTVEVPQRASTGIDAVRDLRRTRQRRRLGDLEWFDVAYRAYLYGFGGLIAVVFVSDALGTLIEDDVDTAVVLRRAPAILGIGVVIAVALGLRSGAAGGPISIDGADVRHVLLAPVDRRAVMLRPASQRLRAAVFVAALSAGVIGQLVGRELEGSRASWAFSAALFGAIVASLFVTVAVIAHAARLPRWAATATGAALVGWQVLAAWATWFAWDPGAVRAGPANLAGSIGLWGIRQRGIDWAAVVVVVGCVLAAGALVGRLHLEPLVRRARLVSQLRFAATVQDIRTVVLLRRQLRSESLRSRPWGPRPRRLPVGAPRSTRVPPARTSAIAPGSFPPRAAWVRSARSLRRLPAGRLGRIAVLAAIGGAAASVSVSATPLFAVVLLIALLLVALEALEPLSEEVDHPDRTDTLPVERGRLYAHLLVAPAGLLAVAAGIGAATATVIDPSDAAAAWAMAIPVAWGGSIGAICTTVRDAAPPIGAPQSTTVGSELSLVPPEFAGFNLVFKAVLPLALTAIGVIPVVAVYVEPSASTVIRSTIGVGLALAFTVLWVIRRDRWSIGLKAFFDAGRQARATPRTEAS